ncbi:VanZ family protein [Candidatus Galacturonibacter soehngenii]|uniref:VanZ family protein n=1 Tax=Candidatus Galacturonatibacter soehngenii TaxID=2307010 RepID=A0A7V7QMX6_9FIRM|nr:VanZ family protein [Candidatus Galacturonibacter soehngenii]KAB1440101.1 VanZ family protein [Candidatus Galacturonibacter soehngenii]
MSKRKIQDCFLYGIFAFYLILLISVTIFKYVTPLDLFHQDRVINRSINFIPFETIIGYMSGRSVVSQTVVWYNILGNICLFMPLGIYLQLFRARKNRFFNSIIIVCIVSLMIELIQFVFGIGATDIDDVMLNCLGGVIGVLLYQVIGLAVKDKQKIKAIITICSSIVAVPMMVLAILIMVVNK